MQPTTPQFTTKAAEKQEFKIRVAIDFGTDGVALAYAIGESSDIKAHAEWNSGKYGNSCKAKTIILLDENLQFLAFGEDAKHNYMTTPAKEDQWLLFEKFKMCLFTNENDDDEKEAVNIRNTLTATNGKQVASSVVFVTAFKYLQEQAKTYLKRCRLTRTLFKSLTASDYQWIISVPAIWSDASKYRMREWAIAAGLVSPDIDEQCKIVLEPECAALAIQYQINRDQSQISRHDHPTVLPTNIEDDEKSEEVRLGKDTKYILVDAGGGTVDIACHEILGGGNGEYGVKEVLAPSGGPWGSCYIDEKFIEMLSEIFSVEWMAEFKRDKPSHYLELLREFEKQKKTFFVNGEESDKHNFRMPNEFAMFMNDKLSEDDGDDNEGKEETDLETFVQTKSVFGKRNLVQCSDEYLKIKNEAWTVLFDHVLDPTIAHIKQLLNEPLMMRHCKYLCLVGGFSSSPYFQHRMKAEFGTRSRFRLSLITPQRPILSVVEGAAYFAITPTFIKARKLRYTYGELVGPTESVARKKNISEAHIQKYKYYNEYDKTWRVNNCLLIIARKNEEIRINQIKKSYTWRPNRTDMIVASHIYYSDMEEPKTIDESHKLGELETEFYTQDETDKVRVLEFHFCDTLIKAIAYNESTPNERKTAYITKYS